MEILKSLNAGGVTVIMVTHSQSQADQASRVVNILDGRMMLSVNRVPA
jgi:putative ABC transport system ATP-binding protein